jgi:hypothetical protein
VITAIITAIGQAETMLNNLWSAYNNSGMVQAKVAQMTQEERDAHNVLLETAMHGNAADRAAATAELQTLVSE